MLREKARWELYKDAACSFEHILEAVPYITAIVQSLTSHLTNHLRWTRHAGHCWRSKDELIRNWYGILHKDQQELTFMSSVWTLNAV